MKKLLLILALLFAVRASAQTQTTVTGTINAPDGSLATSGTVTFTLKPSAASILYYVSGLNVIAPVVGTCGINGSGQVKSFANLSNPCLVWGNNTITPANTTYDVQFLPNGTPTQLIHQILISGTTYSLSSPVFAPQVQINPQFATYYAAPIQANLVPIAGHVFNVGAPQYTYAAGYFDNLFATSISITTLTCSVCVQTASPPLTANQLIIGAGTTLVSALGTLGTSSTVLHGNVLGAPTFGAVNLATDVTGQLPIADVGSAGLSGTSPISVVSTGVISCSTCDTSASALTSNALMVGAGGQATAVLASLGTTTSVLHGNAAGLPTFSAVNLATDVSGQLPIGAVGSAGLSGAGPISIASTGVISCATCQTLGSSVLKKGSNAGNYAGASGSFSAVDGTNLSYTVTIPTGSNLVVTAYGTMSPTGGTTTWYVALFDGASKLTQQALSWTAGGASSSCPGSMNCGDQSFGLGYLIVGNGSSHTITLQYEAEGASNDTTGRILNSGGIFPTMLFTLQ